MSTNIRRCPLTGRHLLAADKPLTKCAISLGAGALPAPRPPTRKTGAGRPRHPRRWPGRQTPASRRSAAASLHKGALTHARAHSHTYTHNKRKPCEPRAEVRWGRSGKPLLPAPTARPARPAHLLKRPRRGPGARSAAPPARLCSACLAGGGDGGGSGPTSAQPRAAAPPTARRSAGRNPPVRPSEPAQARDCRGFSRNGTLTLIIPTPINQVTFKPPPLLNP